MLVRGGGIRCGFRRPLPGQCNSLCSLASNAGAADFTAVPASMPERRNSLYSRRPPDKTAALTTGAYALPRREAADFGRFLQKNLLDGAPTKP